MLTKKISKKAQMIGLDVIISIIILLLAIGLIYYVILKPEKTQQDLFGLEENFFFTNFRANLENTAYNFLDGHKVDEAMLSNFAFSVSGDDIKDLITEEIGVNKGDYDFCLFFQDSTGIVQVNGEDMIGEVYDDLSLTTKDKCINIMYNPCDYYKNALTLILPVLRNGKIMNLNMVVCKL